MFEGDFFVVLYGLEFCMVWGFVWFDVLHGLKFCIVYSENTLLSSMKHPLSTLTFAISSRP